MGFRVLIAKAVFTKPPTQSDYRVLCVHEKMCSAIVGKTSCAVDSVQRVSLGPCVCGQAVELCCKARFGRPMHAYSRDVCAELAASKTNGFEHIRPCSQRIKPLVKRDGVRPEGQRP